MAEDSASPHQRHESDDSRSGSDSEQQHDYYEHSDDDTADRASSMRAFNLCGSLFQWTCQICTRPCQVEPPSPEMLAYAAAVQSRLEAARNIAMSKAAYSRASEAYTKAAATLASAQEPAAAAVSSISLASSAEATAAADESRAPADSAGASRAARIDRFAAVLFAGVTAAGVSSLPSLEEERRTLVSIAAAIVAKGAPIPPDVAAMEEALPPVPHAPPTPSPALLAAQTCKGCNSPFTEPSARPTTRGGGIDSTGRISSGSGSGNAASGAMTHRPAPVNLSILRVTLCDDDADDYLTQCGLNDATTLAAALEAAGRQPLPTSNGAAAAAAIAPSVAAASSSGGGVDSSASGGAGGSIGPVLTTLPLPSLSHQQSTPLFVYDEAMLLHEEEEEDDAHTGGALSSLKLFIPGVVLPPHSRNLHPERPDRLRAIVQHLYAAGLLQRCCRLPARDVTPSELRTVHDGPHLAVIDSLPAMVAEATAKLNANAIAAAVAAVAAVPADGSAGIDAAATAATAEPRSGGVHFGSDTFANAHSLRAARLACGSVVALTEAVCAGAAPRGVALVRPPGHHAEEGEAMG